MDAVDDDNNLVIPFLDTTFRPLWTELWEYLITLAVYRFYQHIAESEAHRKAGMAMGSAVYTDSATGADMFIYIYIYVYI